jgi:hypothetical protein
MVNKPPHAGNLKSANYLHCPEEHVVPPWQVIKQLPQLFGFVRRFASHPFEKTPSQSPQPKLQVSTQHSPLEQKAVALGKEQGLPQAPQFLGSVRGFVQTPPQEVIGG